MQGLSRCLGARSFGQVVKRSFCHFDILPSDYSVFSVFVNGHFVILSPGDFVILLSCQVIILSAHILLWVILSTGHFVILSFSSWSFCQFVSWLF
jgi:hypothetical protein